MLKASQDSPGPLADERAQIIHFDGPSEGFPSGLGGGGGGAGPLHSVLLAMTYTKFVSALWICLPPFSILVLIHAHDLLPFINFGVRPISLSALGFS